MTEVVKIEKTPVVKVQSGLTHREEGAYHSHLAAREHPLAPSLEAELWELYLNGLSCEEIQRVNPSIRLGAIVRSCVEGDWYNRRRDYVDTLLENVRPRVQKTQAQAIMFVTEALEMLHKRYGNRILKYIQTGDEAELGDLKDWGLAQYKQLCEMLLKLTGQDNQKKVGVLVHGNVQHQGEVKHQHQNEASPVPIKSAGSGPPSSEEAARLLEALANFGGGSK